MRTFLLKLQVAIYLTASLLMVVPLQAQAADACPPGCSCTDGGSTIQLTLFNIPKSHFDHANPPVTYGCSNIPFNFYLTELLDHMMPWIFTIATVMIVYAGIQYMLSAVGGGEVKKAKERIIGILIGVAFYFLLRVIINQIGPNFNV
jgi:hypothetical protein